MAVRPSRALRVTEGHTTGDDQVAAAARGAWAAQV